jgi:hypothetical protein
LTDAISADCRDSAGLIVAHDISAVPAKDFPRIRI